MPATSSRKRVTAECAKHGLTIDELDGLTIIDAPVGFVLNYNGEHCHTAPDCDEPMAYVWGDLLDAARAGIAPCPDGDTCDYCAETRSKEF